jgi:HlyD family secretion protein
LAALRRNAGTIVILLVVAATIAGPILWLRSRPAPSVKYRTESISRKAITGKVIASGTLSALVTVQVGTQVSGKIDKLYADYNTRVKAGEIVAKIDPQTYKALADQAEGNYLAAQASVSKAEADARGAERTYARTKALHDQGIDSQSDVDNALTLSESSRAAVEVAKAQVVQTRAALDLARVNLSYTNIVAPIEGVVISRSVDVGQTVAASLSAPTLFTIAEDLTKMQVDTSVAEADVGQLKEGMPATFTVDAFPGRTFPGQVREIRNAAVTVQNVVTYDVVIGVDNTDLRLRPGMTANVTIVYDERASALAAPNAALRFHPPGSPKEGGKQSGAAKDGTSGRTVYMLVRGSPQPVVVHTGLTDGLVTELVGDEVREGDEVVVEAIAPTDGPAGDSPPRRLF